MNRAGPWLRRLALGLLLGVLLLAALTGKVVADGEAELRRSDAAFDRGELRDAVLYARRAAVAYVPGAPHVNAAYERLAAIAIGAESSNQVDVARQAWGAIRSAALETRHLSTPRAADLARANANLARLAAPGDAASPGRTQAAALLARDDAPRAPWVIALGAGFALFALGLGLAASLGVTAEGRLLPRRLVIFALIALAGVACWTLSVYRA